MRTQFYDEHTIPRWLKWSLWIFCIIIVFCIIYSIFLYKNIQSSKTEGFQDSEQIVLDETNVVEIEDIILSHSEQPHHVVIGKTKNGEKKLVFVPLSSNNNKKLTIVNEQDIVSAQSIQQEWTNKCHECEWIKLVPTIVDHEPMWEITYIDNNGRYVIDYLSIYDGTNYEQYRFRPMFKS
ncbi:MAG TPA: DUF5590 domain-containing protein [Bacillota bacterium]